MTVAVLMPTGITDDWRAKARTYVERWYGQHFPEATIVHGSCSGEWSKGAAIADAFERAGSGAQVLVLADADSFLANPETLRTAVDLVRSGSAEWITPHTTVYRLRDSETARLHAVPAATPRLGATCRPLYTGPAGGGITVISRTAFATVGGIDPRFQGWGGEDLALGWALETLVGPGARLGGRLVHLWHPHPAPNLRGSPASEALVDRYRRARGVRRRMLHAIAGEDWPPAPQLAEPIRFRMTANRRTLRLAAGDLIRFPTGTYETTDPDEAEQIRAHKIVTEERHR